MSAADCSANSSTEAASPIQISLAARRSGAATSGCTGREQTLTRTRNFARDRRGESRRGGGTLLDRMDDLAVIVVSHNSARWIAPCLRSVFAHMGPLRAD